MRLRLLASGFQLPKKSGMVFVGALALIVPACSDSSSDVTYSPGITEYGEYSDGDVAKCQDFLNSNYYLEQQSSQDTWTTAIGIVRASYDRRVDAWESVLGSANFEISELTFADDWDISSSADDFESAYNDGLDIVSYSTDPDEIDEALTSVLEAFDALNSVCSDVAY